MSEEVSILDSVTLNNDEILSGILDYSNDRFIHFYDFSGINDPNVIVAAIIWRQQEQHARFSVFCSMFFPSLRLPRVKLINKIAIKDSSVDIEQTKQPSTKERFSVKK